MDCRPDVVDDVCASFSDNLETTKTFKGFQNVSIYRNAERPSRIILVEEWDSRADHEAYMAWRMQGDGKAAFDAILETAPDLQYWDVRVA